MLLFCFVIGIIYIPAVQMTAEKGFYLGCFQKNENVLQMTANVESASSCIEICDHHYFR